MATRKGRLGLSAYVANQWAAEDAIRQRLRSWETRVSTHPGANALVDRLHTMVNGQREALGRRLQDIGGRKPSARTRSSHGGTDTVSAAMTEAFATCTRAAFDYATLHAIAHRFFDRTTADIAEQHMRAYITIARDLNALISDVVVWELVNRGQECQCQCPSCGVGICVCAPHGTATVDEVWRESPVVAAQPGMLVRPPRAHSAAAQAGLRGGDVVVAVDDQEIRSIDDIQNGIRKHTPGEPIRVRVQRNSDQSLEVVITRPQPPS